MPKNARPENMYSCQWGTKLVRHTTSISRPNRVKLSLQPLAQNFGLHGSADSSWGNPLLPFEQEMIKTGKFNAMKLLSRENPVSIDWLSQNRVNVSTVIVRLMLQRRCSGYSDVSMGWHWREGEGILFKGCTPLRATQRTQHEHWGARHLLDKRHNVRCLVYWSSQYFEKRTSGRQNWLAGVISRRNNSWNSNGLGCVF